MCVALSKSGLVPAAYADKPENMIVTIMAGAEIGIPPMAALRLYHIMDSIPRLSSEGIRAVLLSNPEIEYFEPQSCSETQATWIGKRRGRPEKSATWTIERAKRAGLTEKRNRDGSPGNWIKYPEDMLNARASMQLGRMIAPDVVAGMVSLEEARDGDFVDAYSEPKAAQFVAPALALPVAPPAQAAQMAASLRTTEVAEQPRRGPGRPPKAQAENPPTGASAPSPSSASSPPSTAQTSSQPSSPPTSKLAEAVQQVEQKKDRWGQMIDVDPTSSDSSNTGPTPSGESAGASTAPTTSGAVAEDPARDAHGPMTPIVGDNRDDGFGATEDPVDRPVKKTMADFHKWVAGCKTQRDLQAGLQEWRTWSQDQAKAGDTSFNKDGKNTVEMQTTYAKRKGEVPA